MTWIIAAGMCVGLGIFCVLAGSLRSTTRLSDALAHLDGKSHEAVVPAVSEAAGLESAGWWVHQRLRLPVTQRQQQLLLMQDRSVGDFFTERLVLSTAGFFLPAVWAASQFLLGNTPGPWPLVLSLAGAVSGYLWAGARLNRSSNAVRRSTIESLHTFFDLVALERLANQSATQAVASAAGISEAPLFRRITAGLDRARMEQVQPWDELRRIADEWQTPELSDFADVMQLEDQGAALADALQARVRELRDSHQATQRATAQEATENMAVWMTVPALLLGVAFVIPPLLKISGM